MPPLDPQAAPAAALRPAGGRGDPAGEMSRGVQRQAFWIAFAIGLIAVCGPFLTTLTPPLLDYPNHLARIYILGHWASDPVLRQFYEPHWRALPNLAFDIVGLGLSTIMPIAVAGQVTLVLAAALIASGVAVLSAVLYGRPRPFSLLAFLFVFSEPFLWGFVNLVLGTGLLLWGVAGWLWVRPRGTTVLLMLSVPFALTLFFAHLFPFGAYAVIVSCIETTVLRHECGMSARTLAKAAARVLPQFIMPGLIFLLVSPTPLGSSSTHFGPLAPRLEALILSPIRNYSDMLDVLTVSITAVVLGLGLWYKRLQIAWQMRPALLALIVLSFAMPDALSSATNVEIRLPVILMLLVCASADWRLPRLRTMMVGSAALVCLLAARTAATLEAFRQGDRFVANETDLLRNLPRGVRIASITVTAPNIHRIEPEWPHAICYQVIEKSAFVPTVFASPGQQPMVLTARYRAVAFPPAHFASMPGKVLAPGLFADLDYVLIVHPSALQTPLPGNLDLVGRKSELALYRVTPSGR